MDPVLKKLNVKQQEELCVLNSPDSFQDNIAAMHDISRVYSELPKGWKGDFILAFVVQKREVKQISNKLDEALKGDALLWFAYPKKSSKNYKSDISRDEGWEILGKLGWEPVRLVAIDEDWSALRFRRVGYIKKISRRASMALTDEAKKRTSQKDS